jgi:L-fuconolactonase
MIGSDWPVCTVSASYAATIAIVKDYIANLPSEAQEKILGLNCAKFYRLK